MAGFDDFVVEPQAKFDTFLHGLHDAESSLGTAKNINTPNRSGAVWDLQVTPIAAKDMGVDYEEVKADRNIAWDTGKKYAKKMWDMFGEDPTIAAAAYQTGPTAIRRWINEAKTFGTDPREYVLNRLGPEGKVHNQKVLSKFGKDSYKSEYTPFDVESGTFTSREPDSPRGAVPRGGSSAFDKFDVSADTDGGFRDVPPGLNAESLKATLHNTVTAIKGIGGTVGVLGDMFLGFPSMVAGFAGNLGTTAAAAAKGEDRKIAWQAGREANEYFKGPEWFSSPLGTLFKALGKQDIYSESPGAKVMEEVSSLIKKAGHWAEKNSDGSIPAESVETFADSLIIGAAPLGARLIKGIRDIRNGRPAEEVAAEFKARRPGSKEAEVVDAEIIPDRPQLTGPAAKKPSFRDFEDTAAADSFIEQTLKDTAKEEAAQTKSRMLKGAALVSAPAAIAGGVYAYNKFKSQGNQVIDPGADAPEPGEGNEIAGRTVTGDEYDKLLSQFGSLAAIPFAIGAVKGKGGMWHPEAVERLSNPIYEAFKRDIGALPEASRKPVLDMIDTKATSMVKNYLNKHAGTATDPLKDVEIPFGEGVKRWEDITDKSIIGAVKGTGGKHTVDIADFPSGVKEGESVWQLKKQGGWIPGGEIQAQHALTSYLSHVGDYLRQNVDPAKLQQYDLVRAVKETAANDARVAKEMEKAASASTKDLPVYKEYPDGMRWVELRLPEKLTEDQSKNVRRMTPAELTAAQIDAAKSGNGGWDFNPEGVEWYAALDSKGKIIKNNFTDAPAIAETSKEAHLAGQLAQEGNQMGHCVGGYCEGVASGESRIFSLRDKKGQSHVTIEVEPSDIRKFGADWFYEEKATPEFKAKYPQVKYDDGSKEWREWNRSVITSPEFRQVEAAMPNNITQIKGKQNRAPVAEYLPYVQDFVKSGPIQSLEANPFIGYLAKDGKTEFFSELDAKKADYHHSFLVKDMNTYDKDSTLRFVRNDGKNEYTLLGEAAIAPFDGGGNARQIKQLAIKLLDKGADPKAPMIIGEMHLPKIEAPYQSKKIGTLEELSGGHKANKPQWGEVGDFEHTGLYDLNQHRMKNTQLDQHIPPSDLAAYRGHYPQINKGIDKLIEAGNRYVTKEEIFKAGDSEVPTGRSSDIGPHNQRGQADIRLVKALALAGVGATASAALFPDDRLTAGLVGGVLALGLGSAKISSLPRMIAPGSKLARTAERGIEASVQQFIRNVNPDLMGKQAESAASVLGKNYTEMMQRQLGIEIPSQKRSEFWFRQGASKGRAFLKAMEKGATFKDPTFNAYAIAYRTWMDKIYKQDALGGVKYEPVDNYVYHAFEDPVGAAAFFEKRYGVKWGDPAFTKNRIFELIEYAEKHGFKLKTENPEQLMVMRQHASDIASMKIQTLRDLVEYGLARRIEKGKPAVTGEATWRSPNGELYALPDQTNQVMHNAFNTKSLWADPGAGGQIFRALAYAKNMIVPIQLAGLFHPMHVQMGPSFSDAMTAMTKLTAAGKASGFDLIQAGISKLFLTDIYSTPKLGGEFRSVLSGKVPFNKLTAYQKFGLNLMLEGSFNPTMPVEYRNQHMKDFRQAVLQNKLSSVWHLPWAIMEKFYTGPIFETWIPNLKTAAYLRQAYAALKANPELLNMPLERMNTLRRISKQIDDRFGEMNYKTLFMNRIVKDLGIISFLSYGWQAAFMRSYIGAFPELARSFQKLGDPYVPNRIGGLVVKATPSEISKNLELARLAAGMDKFSESRSGFDPSSGSGFRAKIARGELDKVMNVGYYVMSTMFYGGLMTYAMTGQAPGELMDYIFPRSGEKNADGSPARLSTPFYTKDYVAYPKSFQEEGIGKGLVKIIGHKLNPAIGMLDALVRNKDFFNREIRDPNDTFLNQLGQSLSYAFRGVQPMSITGPQKGPPGVKGQVLGVAGFNPAPKYVTDSPLEQKIKHEYGKYHNSVIPYAQARKMEDRSELYRLKQIGEETKFEEKLQQMKEKYNLNEKDEARLRKNAAIPSAERLFSQLPNKTQEKLLREMNAAEQERFRPRAGLEFRYQ